MKVNNKGISLIIVVFAMMLFAVLGWTLTIMQSTDFEANLRNLDSERALYLAEAGAQEALRLLFSGDTRFDSDTDQLNRTLNYGVYNVTRSTSVPTVTVISTGAIPQLPPAQRAMRQVRVTAQFGTLQRALQTQVAGGGSPPQGLFDWYPAIGTIEIEGGINAGFYEGDGDGTFSELGEDYKPPPGPLLPPDSNPAGNYKRDFTIVYPAIDMDDFFNNIANRRWPTPATPPRTITAGGPLPITVDVGPGGNWVRVNTPGFFIDPDDIDTVAIRRTDVVNWWEPGNWTVIEDISNGGRRADVTPSVAWPDGVPIRLIRRFDNNVSGQRWYIGSAVAGGTATDTLIDLRNGNVDFTNSSIISEGDIAIRGTDRIRMRFTGGGTRFPNLATQEGNIISLENVDRNQRRFSGLIYSQNGLVNLNNLEGTIVMGNRVTLDGDIYIRYRNGRIANNGFNLGLAVATWQEQ